MYKRTSRGEYKFLSIFCFIFGIIFAPVALVTLIAIFPFGVFMTLVDILLFWVARHSKKMLKEGFPKEIDNFVATSEVKGRIKFNDNTKQILIDPERNPRIVNYSDVLGFELVENGKTVVTSDDMIGFFDRLTNTRESTTTIHMMRIKIIVRDMNNPNAYIHFIDRETETDSLLYRACYDNAQKILSMLQIATSQRNEVSN
jgi:hypothetical protein